MVIEVNDNTEFLRIAKIVRPTNADIDSIYQLYKRYVDPTARQPTLSGCSTCGNSIVSYWRKLMEWYNVNKS